MKTGNKNQAVMLSIVAVGAIAFLVIQLMPGKNRPFLGGSPAPAQTDGAVHVPTDLPLALVGDPFSHPKLAVKEVVEPKQPPSELTGDIPVRPLVIGPRLPNPAGVVSSSNTEDSAGDNRQKQQGPQISLVGIMDAGTPVAMLQIAGKDQETFREGAMLDKDVWLLQIGHSFVKVLVRGEVHRIEPGETYGAPEDGDKQ
jgi:hypothetical protein